MCKKIAISPARPVIGAMYYLAGTASLADTTYRNEGHHHVHPAAGCAAGNSQAIFLLYELQP